MMPKVKKKDGSKEEFQRSKLEKSLQNAGASTTEASEVASQVEPREGMSTQEIKSQAHSQLKIKNPKAAQSYQKGKSTI